MSILFFVFPLVVLVVIQLSALYRLYAKAGQPGWSALIPVYNIYIWIKIANRPWWWLLLLPVPFLGVLVAINLMVDVCEAFGQSNDFAIGAIFLPVIFITIMAFGPATYTKPVRQK